MGSPLALRAGARADVVVRRQVAERSMTAKIAAGLLVAFAGALLAQLAGADVRAGFGPGPPDLMQQVIRGMLSRPT
jgi:ABC-type uncharacterized transport system permease subunit